MGWVVASTAKQAAAAAAAAATRGTRWRWAVGTAARGSPSALRAAARHDVAADGQRGTQGQTAGRAHVRLPATPAAHRMQLVAPDGPQVGRVRFFVGSRAGDRKGEGAAGDRGGWGESARGRFWGKTGGEGRQWGWRGSHEGRASAAVATGCIVVAGGSVLVLDFLRDQRGPDERWGGVASLVFGSLLTRCESIKESWNLAAVKQKNKNNSTPRDPKALGKSRPITSTDALIAPPSPPDHSSRFLPLPAHSRERTRHYTHAHAHSHAHAQPCTQSQIPVHTHGCTRSHVRTNRDGGAASRRQPRYPGFLRAGARAWSRRPCRGEKGQEQADQGASCSQVRGESKHAEAPVGSRD